MGTSTAYPTPRSRGGSSGSGSTTDPSRRIVFDTFENVSASGTGATWSLDATRGATLSVVTGAGNLADMQRTPEGFVTPRGNFALRFYIEDWTKVNNIGIYLSLDTGFTDYALFTYNVSAQPAFQRNGWHEYRFGDASYVSDDRLNYGALTTFAGRAIGNWRIRVNPIAAQVATVRFAYLDYAPDQDRAQFVISADDGLLSWYTYAIPELDARGMKSTIYVIPALLGVTGVNNYMSAAQLSVAAANGHQVAVHGATAMTSIATPALRAADVAANRDALAALGYSDLTDYAWPNGVFEVAAYDNSLRDMIRSLGFKSARGVINNRASSGRFKHGSFYTTQPAVSKGSSQSSGLDIFSLPIIGHDGTSDVGAGAAQLPGLLGRIDRIVAERSSGILMFHEIGPTVAGNFCALADLQAILNQIATHVSAGNAEVITMRELRRRTQVVDL